jgi:pimeloyl-ACP methyl ester carboxylesterase
MTDWQAGDVEANGIRLHYTRTGGAKPPVVLAHGVTDDGLCWTPVAAALEADYDLVMVDARGHGRSEAPEGGYDSATQARDLAGVIRGLGLRRPAVLGHSMGAMTALVLAATETELPGAILLEDPPAWWASPPQGSPSDQERLAGMRARMLELKRKTREELLAGQRAETPGWSEAELGPWADAKLRVSPIVASLFGSRPATTVDWSATLPRIACPALLITGDPEQGAIVTEDNAAALRALVPHLRVAHVPGSGHSIRRDQPARYLEVVRGFLAEWAAAG